MTSDCGNFGESRASTAEEVSKPVLRIGGAIQPAGERTAALVVDFSSVFIGKLQAFLEGAAADFTELFQKQFANLLIILLTPASLIALVFALWRFSADLGWTGAFVISDGFFSHWQVWMALAVALKLAASSLHVHVRASQSSVEN